MKPNCVGKEIHSVGNLIKRQVDNLSSIRYADQLTGTNGWIIDYLYHHQDQDIFQKDIEKELDLSNPTVTGIVKRLEEKEMITRVPSSQDARYKCLTLTDKGLKVIHKCMDFGVNYIENKLTKNMTEDELNTLRTLLNRVLNNMDE